jgi:hypothetical protein
VKYSITEEGNKRDATISVTAPGNNGGIRCCISLKQALGGSTSRKLVRKVTDPHYPLIAYISLPFTDATSSVADVYRLATELKFHFFKSLQTYCHRFHLCIGYFL